MVMITDRTISENFYSPSRLLVLLPFLLRVFFLLPVYIATADPLKQIKHAAADRGWLQIW